MVQRGDTNRSCVRPIFCMARATAPMFPGFFVPTRTITILFSGFLFVFLDRQHNFSFDKYFDMFKSKGTFSENDSGSFRKRASSFGFGKKEVEDADFYEIKSNKVSDEKVEQEVIDEILDKISRSGYQNLTEKEKKILFEASKKN